MSPRLEDGATATGISLALNVAEGVSEIAGLFKDIFLNVAGDGVTELAKWTWTRYQRRSKGKNLQAIIDNLILEKQLKLIS